MEKKVMISYESYNRLVQDMMLFGFVNEDKSPKYNTFYTTLLINTFKYLENKETTKTISNRLRDLFSQVNMSSDEYERTLFDYAVIIKNDILSNDKDIKNEKAIFIQWTENNASGLEQILNSHYNLQSSVVFRNIINEYLTLPQYIRERIIFSNQYNELLRVKKSKCKCVITSNAICGYDSHNRPINKKYTFELIEITPGKEEFHTYVIGYATKNGGTRSTMSIKLSTIKNVAKLDEATDITQSEIISIKEKIKDNPAFINNEYKDFKVQFTDVGKKLINKFYKDRPYFDYKNVEKNIFTFSCTEIQITNYLKQFGNDAILIEPLETKEKLKRFYLDALKAYD